MKGAGSEVWCSALFLSVWSCDLKVAGIQQASYSPCCLIAFLCNFSFCCMWKGIVLNVGEGHFTKPDVYTNSWNLMLTRLCQIHALGFEVGVDPPCSLFPVRMSQLPQGAWAGSTAANLISNIHRQMVDYAKIFAADVNLKDNLFSCDFLVIRRKERRGRVWEKRWLAFVESINSWFNFHITP